MHVMKHNLYDMIQQKQGSSHDCTDNTTSTTRHHKGAKPAQGLRKILAILMLMTISISTWAQTNANYVPFEFYTSINQITGNFAIVNAAEGKALYGTNNQNIGYANYATAFATGNVVTQYRLELVNGNYRLRCVTPAGGNYGLWGSNPCYLNCQPATGNNAGNAIFNLGQDQDQANGSTWILNYVNGRGWTIESVARRGWYCSDNNQISQTPYYWQLCSLADNSFANNNYVFYSGGNNGEYLGTSTDGTTTFNPSTCIWTGSNNGTFHNENNNYLRNNNTWFLTSANNASNCTLGGTENGTTGQTIRMGTTGTAYYLRYNNNAWSRSTTASRVVFKVTRNILPSQSTAPTISGEDQIAQLGNTAYTRTNAAYQPACYDYVFYNGAHHYCTSATADATATRPSEAFTYTWSLYNENGTAYAGANVSVNNDGVVNYQTSFANDTRLVLRLTATYASKTFNVDKTITFKSGCTTPTITFNNSSKTVSVSGAAGETLLYKVDNSYNDNGAYAAYTSPIAITGRTRVWAKATKTGSFDSEEASIIVDNPYNVVPVTNSGVNLTTGDSYEMTYTLAGPTNGEILYDRVVYSMADESIASVDQNGHIIAIKKGSTKVILTGYKLDGTTLNPVEVDVTVKNPYNDPTSMSVTSTNQTINIGDSWQISATAYGEAPVYQKFKYEVTGTSGKVSVDANGLVTGLTEGTTEITVTAYNYGDELSTHTQTIQITVQKPTTINGKTCVYALSDILNNSGGSFILMQDIAVTGNTSITGFTGTLDGNFKTISGLTNPLFITITNATVYNVIVDNSTISRNGDVGAIAGQAAGASRIYNCGVLSTNGTSTVTCTQNGSSAGGIVGYLNNTSRVINCYSYADVSAVTNAGGIVGYVQNASTRDNVSNMVMNCMFYGDITGGTNKYPVYGGQHTQNVNLTNYNYFHNDKLPESHISEYNSALAALDKNLTRFEFYRSILNSNRKLAAWYITGNVANTDVVAKWVLDPEIAPYPILKPWGKYPSVINRASYAAGTQAELTAKKITPSQDLSDGTNRYMGKVLGVLKVNLQRGANGTGDNTTIYLPITDMDTNHFDYNYYKVQLPYYNDYFGGNYTTKAVTGWDIVSVVGGTTGTLSTSGNNAYNYADRKCTAKDANRTFAQGGFYYVPEGVSEITIRAHWANAVYLKDINSRYDNVYTGDGTYTAFTAPGTIPNYGVNNTTTYTSWATAANSFTQGNSVYDNVIILISNHRATSSVNQATKPYSIMSIDLDHDNEPDYILTQEFNDRQDIDPIRFDFLFQVGAGMAQKRNNSTNYNSIGIYHPKGHFEITETSCAQFTEFEYNQNRNTAAPLILMNSIVDQIVSAHNANVTTTNYVILGGHLWMKAYTPGCHTDNPTNTYTTQFAPVTVLGGDYESFYLTGMRPQTRTNNVTGRIYTNGGRMKEYASSYQEQLNGNVFAKFDHSVVWEFYGGGVSATTPVKGDINVEINHSMVSQYVGGPKFGYIQSGKKVETKATGTVFGYYYGASYGGTSLRKPKPNDATGATYDYNWVNDNFNSIRLSRSNNNELLTGYQIEFFSYAGGRTPERRLYQEWASLSLSTTLKTRSVLDSCYVKHDYFGGGRLGKVQTGNNDTLVSIINNSLIDGNAYGGGFSASIPTLEVMKAAVQADMPIYNGNTGIYSDIKYPETESYTWTNETLDNYVSQSRKLLQTTENLNDLGKVAGNTFIQVENTHVKGHVFGGGFGSEVTGNTEVVILGSSVIEKNVYGGGNAAEVGGDTRVVIGE